MKTIATLVFSTLGLAGTFATAAVAAPHYRAHYYQPRYQPYIEDYDAPPPVGFVFMRHTARCEYPHGWSVTDFNRNINGIPRGGDALLATGCGTFDPLFD